MTIALPKGDFLVTAGFAAITGAGVASGFKVLSTTSTWLLILAADCSRSKETLGRSGAFW